MKTILAAVDFSKNTEAVVKQAAKLAKALCAKLWVVHVTSDQMQAMIHEAGPFNGFTPEFDTMPGDVQMARTLNAAEIKREHSRLLGISATLRNDGIEAQAVLLKGDAAPLIIEKANGLQADIIVLGSHGHGLLRKALLGSVSESVMRQASCNVMVVPMPAD